MLDQRKRAVFPDAAMAQPTIGRLHWFIRRQRTTFVAIPALELWPVVNGEHGSARLRLFRGTLQSAGPQSASGYTRRYEKTPTYSQFGNVDITTSPSGVG